MLIQNVELEIGRQAGARFDVRFGNDRAGRIEQVAPAGTLSAGLDEVWMDGQGHLLLPGLQDHHLHLAALAVALDSLRCGPPQVRTAAELAVRLEEAASAGEPGDWLRGVGYHESVAGELDRHWLDRVVAHRPVRIQHRSGRLWMLNSAGLAKLLEGQALRSTWPAGLLCQGGEPTGRILDADDWLARRLPRRFPDLRRASRLLAGYGITGLTDTTPRNGPEEWNFFQAAQASGALLQSVCLMGDRRLDRQSSLPDLQRGALKIHLHEHDLPDLDTLTAQMAQSHEADRPVALHCVTLAELVFALGALEIAGPHPGDRIEHAAIAPPEVLPLLAARGVTVVTQPNFIFERGEAYRRDVPESERPWLYRLRGLMEAGIPLAGSTDAPFGEPNPWAAMQAAVTRCTTAGVGLGEAERLTPEAALALFLGRADAPGAGCRQVKPGGVADLILLDRSWKPASADLSQVRVRATFKAGRLLVD